MQNTVANTDAPHTIARLIARRQPGFSLEQAFYASEAIFAQDVQSIFMTEWHFAGLVSEIPDTGDYFLFEMLNESVIVSRDNKGDVHALANVCRHRGSRVCLEPRGNTKRFTCPYHAWIYQLDGSLFNARLMGADTDTSKLGLKPVPITLFHGMIFISFADEPRSFDHARRELDTILAPFGLDRLKIAKRARYPVKANWKLLVENYNECYHCAPAHPEFTRAHPTHMAPDRVAPLNQALQARARELSISTDQIDRVGPDRPKGSLDYTYSRHSLYEGFETGSDDGKPVAPLLGDLKGYDTGASDLYLGILNPMLIYNDHVVIYRFLPVDKDHSVQEIIWLVHEGATEGRDYDLQRLTWLWDLTTIADKLIIEKNQEGVNSRYYEPGPLAAMEAYTERFLDLYIAALARSTRHPEVPDERL